MTINFNTETLHILATKILLRSITTTWGMHRCSTQIIKILQLFIPAKKELIIMIHMTKEKIDIQFKI